jgi:hypothetical protein
LRRQQFLEALSWQGFGASPQETLPWIPMRHYSQYSTQESDIVIDMEIVVKVLKSLETLCTQNVIIVPSLSILLYIITNFVLFRNLMNYVIV